MPGLLILSDMTAIIYTHPPDYLMAGFSALMLARQGLHVVIAIGADDPMFSCECATVIRTHFPRRGNLNGVEFIRGHLALMREHATGKYSIKIDSDTLLLDAAAWLAGHDVAARGIYSHTLDGMQGLCYALRVADIPAMEEHAAALDPRAHSMEDRTIGMLAARCGPVHLPQWRVAETLYETWDGSKTDAHYRAQHVLLFLWGQQPDRARAARAMREFLEKTEP